MKTAGTFFSHINYIYHPTPYQVFVEEIENERERTTVYLTQQEKSFLRTFHNTNLNEALHQALRTIMEELVNGKKKDKIKNNLQMILIGVLIFAVSNIIIDFYIALFLMALGLATIVFYSYMWIRHRVNRKKT